MRELDLVEPYQPNYSSSPSLQVPTDSPNKPDKPDKPDKDILVRRYDGKDPGKKMRMWVNGSPRLAQPYREAAKGVLDTTSVIMHPTCRKQGPLSADFASRDLHCGA